MSLNDYKDEVKEFLEKVGSEKELLGKDIESWKRSLNSLSRRKMIQKYSTRSMTCSSFSLP